MKDFVFKNPVKIIFGKDVLNKLSENIKDINSILLVYGGGSIKKTGLYDKVIDILKDKDYYELGGIIPNPEVNKVYEGIKICKEKNIDLILAVGGGSTIDTAKAISAGSKTDKDFWESFFINKEKLDDATPIGVISTFSGTGSEMNCGGVITNPDVKIKCSYGDELLYPKFSILDPTLTFTVPTKQMVSGIIDMFSHLMEVYFSYPDSDNVSDSLSEALMASIVRNARIAINDEKNYEARSNLMWASTLAINGLFALGKGEDWQSHTLEHTLSAYYGIPHGLGLAIIHPNYLRYVKNGHEEKFRNFYERVFNKDSKNILDSEIADVAILELTDFFKELGAPTTLKELGIDDSRLKEMAENTVEFKVDYSDLKKEDILSIYKMSL